MSSAMSFTAALSVFSRARPRSVSVMRLIPASSFLFISLFALEGSLSYFIVSPIHHVLVTYRVLMPLMPLMPLMLTMCFISSLFLTFCFGTITLIVHRFTYSRILTTTCALLVCHVLSLHPYLSHHLFPRRAIYLYLYTYYQSHPPH